MIEYIRGELVEVTSTYIVVDKHQIGYLIYCPNPFSFFPAGKTITVYTYQYVREDALHLYGFHTREDRQLFIHLLNVSGIGPKGALAVLASGETNRVVQAIEAEDESFLTKFPGIGKKTARQMILDLKGKLKGFRAPVETDQPQDLPKSQSLEEAIQALQALGYSDKEIKKVLPELEKEELTSDQYIRRALQLMLRD
ncbi:MAG: Holliday junction branch migration protein RuvA [Tuberibacillus sp.]